MELFAIIMKMLDYKAPGGKLLRLALELQNGTIKEIRINGDFFVYPENDLMALESLLKGTPLKEVKKITDEFIARKGTKIIGFSSNDLAVSLSKLL